MYKDFLPPPPTVDNTNIYEQIILEEEEIHNLKELDTKLKTIYYKPGMFMKFLKWLLLTAGTAIVGGAGYIANSSDPTSLIGKTYGGKVSTFGWGLSGLIAGTGVYLILRHIASSFAKNIVNSNMPTKERLNYINQVLNQTKQFYSKIRPDDIKSKEYVNNAINELKDAYNEVRDQIDFNRVD